ncbi:hypothetical protein KIN34_01775 [Cellulomonas sp. DKR-3]|uniref:YbjN domain-containing protein n=1 Tax=Cellulomonas fulva TaxID=2835530 RepID=A0ABS5TV60_9CELL|nr:YbjN domain-containing protein [Cellulomonas fulva]MBT0993020.1 hypothetical protein [Cellulomonas fulva]
MSGLTEDDLFYARVVAAFVDAGRDVVPDAAARTLDVRDGDGAPVLVVVRPAARTVTLYASHLHRVPSDERARVADLVVRATSDLFVATLDLDTRTGVVSARHALALGEVEPPDDALVGLVVAALEEVGTTIARYAPAVTAVLAGTEPATAAADVLRADLTA